MVQLWFYQKTALISGQNLCSRATRYHCAIEASDVFKVMTLDVVQTLNLRQNPHQLVYVVHGRKCGPLPIRSPDPGLVPCNPYIPSRCGKFGSTTDVRVFSFVNSPGFFRTSQISFIGAGVLFSLSARMQMPTKGATARRIDFESSLHPGCHRNSRHLIFGVARILGGVVFLLLRNPNEARRRWWNLHDSNLVSRAICQY